MGRSRNRGKNEAEHLRGRIRELEKELKYYRKRAHIENTIFEDLPVEEVDAVKCPNCKSGILISYDFRFIILEKCSECDFQIRKKK